MTDSKHIFDVIVIFIIYHFELSLYIILISSVFLIIGGFFSINYLHNQFINSIVLKTETYLNGKEILLTNSDMKNILLVNFIKMNSSFYEMSIIKKFNENHDQTLDVISLIVQLLSFFPLEGRLLSFYLSQEKENKET